VVLHGPQPFVAALATFVVAGRDASRRLLLDFFCPDLSSSLSLQQGTLPYRNSSYRCPCHTQEPSRELQHSMITACGLHSISEDQRARQHWGQTPASKESQWLCPSHGSRKCAIGYSVMGRDKLSSVHHTIVGSFSTSS